MAKSTKNTQTPGKLAGKTVALVGKFSYRDMFRSLYESQVVRAGGKVVDAATTIPDYVFVGEGRGGKPPGEVAKLQKKSPEIQVLQTADFLSLLLPDRDELLREIAKGHRNDKDRYWVELEQLFQQTQGQIDLQKADLKKADLYGAHLEGVMLTGSDLRGANTQYTHFSDLENVKFDDCDGKYIHLQKLENCTFRNADLEHAWISYGSANQVRKCDFKSAKMAGARIQRGVVSDCKFVGADLSDAEMEKSVFERTDFTKADMSRIHATESKFDGSTLAKANLTRADLRKASLVGADLNNANLREALLNDADLNGANISGADFQDAVLTGAKLEGLDISKAKNLKAPVVKAPGKKLLELAAAAAGAKQFTTTAEVDLGPDEFARLELLVIDKRVIAHSNYHRKRNSVRDRVSSATFEQGMLNLADRWPKSTLRLDTIQAKGSKTLRGQKLQDLAVAAWAETFGVPVVAAADLKAQREDQQAAAARERDELMSQIRAEGAKVWNSMDYRLRRRVDLRGVELSGAKLDKLSMVGCDLKGANFAASSLVESEFFNGQLANVVFTGANLQSSRLQNCVFHGANFRDAVLTGADLTNSKLQGADFTGATLKDTNLFTSQFDQTTIFPSGFKSADDMIWKGEGPRPGAKKVKAAKAGSLDFESFLEKLGNKMEVERMKKAGSMLKAERFQLFAEVKEDSLLGIVKSQSNKELVYSCRLTSDGAFGCCTQNLRPCGGLRGALCKHLLVLVIGLAKAGQLDAATVDHWVNLSKGRKPAIDEESMSATFLRYKGAEAGEVDWRPTETIPEDFYAM